MGSEMCIRDSPRTVQIQIVMTCSTSAPFLFLSHCFYYSLDVSSYLPEKQKKSRYTNHVSGFSYAISSYILYSHPAQWTNDSLIILCLYLEVSLWMVTYRTYFRCFFTNTDMSTVRTLPDYIAVFRKYQISFDIC